MNSPHPAFRSFVFDSAVSPAKRLELVVRIEALPQELRQALAGCSASQLDTPYRAAGWTLRQVAHHLADSHMHAYARMRLAMTEETPTIKPYDQDRWAELADARTLPLEPSLQLLEGLHARWGVFLRSLTTSDWARAIRHPEFPPAGQVLSLDWMLQHYAWHGRHHVEQITACRERMAEEPISRSDARAI